MGCWTSSRSGWLLELLTELIIKHACGPTREGWNIAFIFNASLSRDSVVCNSGLNCAVQEVLQVDVAKA